MGTLYKLTFANGKEYIGITRSTMARRFYDHKKAARNGSYPYAIYTAWRKYGEPILSVLAVVEDADLCDAERRAIKKFNTKAPHGYNLTDGGEGVVGKEVTQATRDKLRAANLGKIQSPETRAKRSLSLTGRPVSAETRAKIGAANAIRSKGKTHSLETRAKIGALSKGRTHAVSEAVFLQSAGMSR